MVATPLGVPFILFLVVHYYNHKVIDLLYHFFFNLVIFVFISLPEFQME